MLIVGKRRLVMKTASRITKALHGEMVICQRRDALKTKFIYIYCVIIILLLSGCTSKISATRGDEGMSYYLPKPYLLIAKNIALGQTKVTTKVTEVKEDKKVTTTTETITEPVFSKIEEKGDLLSFQIIYLPDLTEKHSLNIESGTGTLDTTITLVDGWKFTGVNLKADAKTSDVIQAIGSVIGNLPLTILTGGMKSLTQRPVEKEKEEVDAGLWLYEIRVEDGRIKYDLVIEWHLKKP